MQLSKYIGELLYRYECVMVPNFGGFVSNTITSQLDSKTHQFTPPSKTIAFNVNLQQNDGLLLNHIAKSLHISFDVAAAQVQQAVTNWKQELENGPLLLPNIGQFTLVQDQLTFEPIYNTNYLTSAFGLHKVDANLVLQNKINPPTNNVVRKKAPTKYIAIAAAVTGLLLGGNTYVNHMANQQEILRQQEITQQIQKASFRILTPLPAVKLTLKTTATAVTKETTYKYHIIAGAFKDAANAEKKVTFLKQKGYEAKVIGLNNWGLTQVSYASFKDKKKAINTLYQIRKEDNKHAWLFIKE